MLSAAHRAIVSATVPILVEKGEPPVVYGDGHQEVRLGIDQHVKLQGEGFNARLSLKSQRKGRRFATAGQGKVIPISKAQLIQSAEPATVERSWPTETATSAPSSARASCRSCMRTPRLYVVVIL